MRQFWLILAQQIKTKKKVEFADRMIKISLIVFFLSTFKNLLFETESVQRFYSSPYDFLLFTLCSWPHDICFKLKNILTFLS